MATMAPAHIDDGYLLSQVYYQTPQPEFSPFEGLAPPQRPNFQPIYSEVSPATKLDRVNDKSVGNSHTIRTPILAFPYC